MSGAPRTSVIVPAYDAAPFLAETIESVFAQDFESLEVVVIDDGSTDETPSLLAGLGERFGDRLRFERQPNRGVSNARNRGIERARGEYLVFLDADDVLLPNKLDEQVRILDADPQLAYVHSAWQCVDANGKPLELVEPWTVAPDLELTSLLQSHPFYLGAITVRRQWVVRNGGFDEALPQAEDVDLLLRWALAGARGAWLKKPTILYRQHEGSLTRNGPQRIRCVDAVLARFFARSDLPPQLQPLERPVRYNVLLWGAWQLHRSARREAIVDLLHRSRALASGSARQTVQAWFHRLLEECRRDDREADELRAFFPEFRSALELDDARWAPIARLLNVLVESAGRIGTVYEGDRA